ncbi:hypothetical protein J7J18_04485 [bacterium]|nr:hypothetical protein [bacterium]
MKFFFGLDGSSVDRKIDYPYVLISAATLWGGKRFREMHTHENVKEVFLDSGGFSFFYKTGEYPFSVGQYVSLIKKEEPQYAAVMDYPCESDVVRKGNLKTNRERIDKTIENAIKCLEHEEINWVMVVQGYKGEEYLYSIDRIKEQGIETDVMAIGSLCVRKKIDEARRIISLVRKNTKAKLHGFGIDFRFLKDTRIFNMLYSADSQAWKWNNRAYSNAKGYLPKSQEQKLKNFKFYKERIERLIREQHL